VSVPLELDSYLEQQPELTRHLFHHLDRGLRALAPDVVAEPTQGRKCVGGVSYSTPERRFCLVDLRPTGRGLACSVFTDGQPWEGVSRSRSSPWGLFPVRSEADLPRALALAQAAYDTVKRTSHGHGPLRRGGRRSALA
jgi:hypothetical protein